MDDELLIRLAEFEKDPLGFVRWAFPWGEAGALAQAALDPWQEEFFHDLGSALREKEGGVVRMARSTGHGVGKSATVGMLCQWAMATMPDTKGVVTANTENQLKTKTWVEIAKWNRLSLTRSLFSTRATAMTSVDPEHSATWRLDVVPWSERNTEAFAGLHNEGRRIVLIFDEASAIPDVIHEVAEGALTDENTQIIWVMFGNPTRNTGRFREAAPDGKFGKRWNFKELDSRSVSLTNKKQIQEWLEDYGEDSDFFRVRVRGMFPRADAVSFIPYEDAKNAVARPLHETNEEDVVLGVDVARYGDNASVIYPRQGRDARSRAPDVYFGLSTFELAQRVRDAVHRHNPVCVFVDETGVGAGVVDNLRAMQLPCLVVGVNFGSKSDDLSNDRYANKRSEIWGLMRDWLKTGCIPEHLPGLEQTLVDELTGPTYGFNNLDAIMLESKRDMRRRNVASPDGADALACTFALPLPSVRRSGPRNIERPTVAPDYDPIKEFI